MRTHGSDSSGGGTHPEPARSDRTSRKFRFPKTPSFHSLFTLLQSLLVPEPDGGAYAIFPTDEELLAAMQARDREALGQLYARYSPALRALAMRLVRDPEDAEDLLQDVFCEAWRSAGSYDPSRASVRTWLLVRLRSRATDRYRSACSRRSTAHLSAQIGESGADPTEDAGLRYLSLLVSRCVSALPARKRRLIELAYFQDLSMAEVAEELGCPIGTVKSRLHRLLHQVGALSLVRAAAAVR